LAPAPLLSLAFFLGQNGEGEEGQGDRWAAPEYSRTKKYSFLSLLQGQNFKLKYSGNDLLLFSHVYFQNYFYSNYRVF
jgi:hypothetical protein